jgi:outer membrane protein TolC
MHGPESSKEGSVTKVHWASKSINGFFVAVLVLHSQLGCLSRPARNQSPIPAPVASSPIGWQGTAVVGAPAHEVLPGPTGSTVLSLEECQRLALAKQPKVNAHRASLAAAQNGKHALDKLRIPASLSGQIPCRRQQAELAIGAAAAGLDRAEREAVYAVTRTYLTVVFAREQERVAKSTVERLNAIKEAAQKALDAGVRDATAADVQRSLVYQRLAETKHIQATQGVERARIALREALGLGPECSVDIPPGNLPDVTTEPSRQAVVSAAVTRRGELLQATLAAQIAELEVGAQGTSIFQQMSTVAAGLDFHSTQVPTGSNGTEYQPGGLLPEMPTLLVGNKHERMKQARDCAARAATLVETARNLVALEAEDAFLRWQEASQQARKAREAADTGDKLADDLRKDLAAGLKVKVEDVIGARVLAAQARGDYNEFHYRELVALADLERATAGGFAAGRLEVVESPEKKVELPEKKQD